jgi:hypothetical protein
VRQLLRADRDRHRQDLRPKKEFALLLVELDGMRLSGFRSRLITNCLEPITVLSIRAELSSSHPRGQARLSMVAPRITLRDPRRTDYNRYLPAGRRQFFSVAALTSVLHPEIRLKNITVEIRAGNAIRRYPAVKSCEPDDLVFASVVKGAPVRDNAILTRFIKPAARALGMGSVNWQVLRRSHATWLKLAGADVKDAQAQDAPLKADQRLWKSTSSSSLSCSGG